MAKIIKNNISYTSIPSSASMLPYDNHDSGLSADNVKDAIDELAEGGGGSSTFAGLSDVSITNVQNGQVPKYNSQTQKWENANESGGGSSTFAGLSDVSFSSLQNGQVAKYNSTTQKWENANESGGGSTVTVTQIQSTGNKIATIGVDGVNTDLYSPSGVSSVAVTQVQSTGTKIGTINVDGASTDLYAPNGGGASALNDLTDVTISSATNGQVLKYNGSNWVNSNDSTGVSSVTVTQVQTTGTKIATITVDSTSTDVYAPSGGGGSSSADQVSYDNTTSGLTATNVQDAIDEVVTDLGSKADASDVPQYIQDLDNVTVSSASNGQILKYNGSAWVNANESTGSTVSVTQIQSTGTKIATVTVDSIGTDLYAPAGGGGTVTSVTIQASSPISVDDSTAITTSGTRTLSHATSGATAGSYGDSSAQTPGYAGTFKVPYVTVDTYGHVTSISDHNVTIPSVPNLSNVGEVSISSLTTGDILKYNGTNWVNTAETTGSTVSVTQVQSTGTKIATITVDSVGTDIYAPNSGGASALNDLSDVTISSASNGQVLKYSNGDWINAAETVGSVVSVTQIQSTGTKIATVTIDSVDTDIYAPTGGGGASSLNDLSDVTITSQTAGDILEYDGSNWINKPIWVEVTGTLSAGSTSITLQDNAITTSSTIDVYTDGDVDYNTITVATGSVTLTFDAQSSALGVKVRVS